MFTPILSGNMNISQTTVLRGPHPGSSVNRLKLEPLMYDVLEVPSTITDEGIDTQRTNRLLTHMDKPLLLRHDHLARWGNANGLTVLERLDTLEHEVRFPRQRS